MSEMRERKQPKAGAQPQLSEHLARWQEIFHTRVAAIAPGMVHAETEKRLREADALHAAYPGATSESFHKEYKASTEELVARQQTSIAEGHVFRELFADMEPLAMLTHLNTQTVNPAWLVGFANDEAVRRRYEQEARMQEEATLRKRMSVLGLRPKKPRKAKWSQSVRDEAIAYYREWYEAARQTRNTHGSLWGTKWKDFATACIQRIKKKTGAVVTADQLRRSLLPVKDYPRP